MAISSEIEKLERRWQQSSGLVFAPLAEAYRKAGLHARALEILEQGLALHADYAPALIVRARCHLDTGDLAAAEAAFHQALGRDPTDPIALRGLADVFERTDRLPEAVERLQALVDVDPRNSEARQVLDRLLATPPKIVAAVEATPAERAQEFVEPVRDQLDSLDLDVVNLSAVESLPALPEQHAPAPVGEEFLLQSFAFEPIEVPVIEEASGPVQWTPASVSSPPEPEVVEPELATGAPAAQEPFTPIDLVVPFEAAEPVDADEPVEAVEVVEVADVVETVDLVDPVASVDAVEPAPVVEPVEFTDTMELEAVGGYEPPAAELAPDWLDEPAVESVEEPTVAEYASFVDPALDSEPADAPPEPAPEPVIEPMTAPALIVTESMAELFLKQGHRELALAVYRQLLGRTPDADHLRGAIARLEQELAAPAAPAPSRRLYAASDTGGRSIERRLQAVLHAPPPSSASTVLPPAIESGAEPTRASGDALSLAAVFGDEPGAQPRREPDPAPGADEPSYDEFFGAGPSEPAAAPAPHGEGEDLRQFNEWLKGLKR